MHKTFRIDEKHLAAKYNRRLFLINLPSIAIALSLSLVVLLFITLAKTNPPIIIYRTIFYATYFCAAYSFIVCLTGSIISAVVIKSHRLNTYIEISDSVMVISEHYRTCIQDFKLVYYKKMWVVKLKDVTEVSCVRNHITILSNARYFCERTDWLGYEKTDNGISFDNWWYDSHGGKNVNTIEITDFYTYGERIVRRIAFCSHKIKEREERREAFRREMLEIARNTKKRKGITDKYQEPKRRVFRP